MPEEMLGGDLGVDDEEDMEVRKGQDGQGSWVSISIGMCMYALMTPSPVSDPQPQILVDKVWGVLLKAKAVRDPDAEDEGPSASIRLLIDKHTSCPFPFSFLASHQPELSLISPGRAARGGCELCGREMPLTRHHLRPRSTHRKFLKQVNNKCYYGSCCWYMCGLAAR